MTLHEAMRRDGCELAGSKSRVVFREGNGEKLEPIEAMSADVEDQHQSAVMQTLCERKRQHGNHEHWLPPIVR